MFKLIKRTLITVSFLILIATNILSLTSMAFNAAASGLIAGAYALANPLISALAEAPSNLKTVRDKFNGRLASKDKKLVKQGLTIKQNTKVLTSKNNEIAKHTATIAKNRKSVIRTGKSIYKRTWKLAATSVTSIPMEAVPVIGVATIVAVTAYELTTACQNFNDLNHLYVELGVPEAVDTGAIDFVCNPTLPSVKDIWTSTDNRSTPNTAQPSQYEKFQEDLGGTLSQMAKTAKAKKTKFDDAVGGTLFTIMQNWGFK